MILQLRLVAPAAKEVRLFEFLRRQPPARGFGGFPQLDEPLVGDVNLIRLLNVQRFARVEGNDHRFGFYRFRLVFCRGRKRKRQGAADNECQPFKTWSTKYTEKHEI